VRTISGSTNITPIRDDGLPKETKSSMLRRFSLFRRRPRFHRHEVEDCTQEVCTWADRCECSHLRNPRVMASACSQYASDILAADGTLSASTGNSPPSYAELSPSCTCWTPRQARTASTCSTSHTSFDRWSDTRSEASRDVFMLYASPLFHPAINFKTEGETLRKSLAGAKVLTQLKMSVATASSLSKLLTLARSRRGLVLHIVAHGIKDAEKGLGLMLEGSTGRPHVLWRAELEQLLMVGDGVSNISLLFLNCCNSEELAQIFIERGCPHVIATIGMVREKSALRFSHQLYFELSVGSPLLTAFESARQALCIDPDPDIAAQADHFRLYGQRGADRATLDTLCGDGSRPVEMLFEHAWTFLDSRLLPSRPENFVGREHSIERIVRNFEGFRGRRACVVHGPSGMGKSALGIEFAHFVSGPGRLFSCAALRLCLNSSNLADIVESLEEELEGLAASLGLAQRTALSWSSSIASSRSEISVASVDTERQEVCDLALSRGRLRRLVQRLEKSRRLVLIIDDEVGAVAGSAEVRSLFGDMLDYSQQLHLLILSSEAVYESLGATKVVNEALHGLTEAEAARLFVQRIHRSLRRDDLPPGTPMGSLPGSDAMNRALSQLSGHPLLKKLGGHPGRIRAVSHLVAPGGPNLYDLADQVQFVEPQIARRQQSLPCSSRPLTVGQLRRPFSAVVQSGHDAVDLR